MKVTDFGHQIWLCKIQNWFVALAITNFGDVEHRIHRLLLLLYAGLILSLLVRKLAHGVDRDDHCPIGKFMAVIFEDLRPFETVIQLKRNNEELVNRARNIKKDLQSLGLGRVILENSGNIGKGYRRHDEIGTPICITVDFETLEDETVTIRNRDTMQQKRVSIKELSAEYQKIFE